MFIYLPKDIVVNEKIVMFKEINLEVFKKIEHIHLDCNEFEDYIREKYNRKYNYLDFKVYRINDYKICESVKLGDITSVYEVNHNYLVKYLENRTLLNWDFVSSFLVFEGTYLFSLKLFERWMGYLNIDTIFRYYSDVDLMVENYLNDPNIHEISSNDNFKERHFYKFYDIPNEINWKLISYNDNFSSDFFEKNFHLLKYYMDWKHIIQEINVSDRLIDLVKSNLFDIYFKTMNSKKKKNI